MRCALFIVSPLVCRAIVASSRAYTEASAWPVSSALVGFFGYGVSLTLFVLPLRHLGMGAHADSPRLKFASIDAML